MHICLTTPDLIDICCCIFSSSFLAGLFGAIASNPIDVVKVSKQESGENAGCTAIDDVSQLIIDNVASLS